MEEKEDDILRQLRFTMKSQLGSNFDFKGLQCGHCGEGLAFR